MKLKKACRRLTAALIVLSMVLSLAACGKDSGGSSGGASSGGSQTVSEADIEMPQLTSKDGVVRARQVVLEDPEISTDGLQILALEDGWFYAANNNYEGDGLEDYQLVRFKTDGTGYEAIDYQVDMENQEVAALTFADGCYYLAISTISNSPALEYELSNIGDTQVEIPDALSEDAISTYRLCCVTLDGEEKWSTQIDASLDDEYYYINSVEATEKGIMVCASNGVDCYSAKDGSFVEKSCTVKAEEMMGTLYILRDGTVIMADDSSSSVKISAFNAASGKFEDMLTLPTALSGAMLFPGKSYSFYFSSENGVYGANPGSDTLAPVVNFINSDLDIQGIIRMIEIEDGQLVIQVYSSDFSLDTYILEPVAPEDVEEKTEITLGGYYFDYEVRSEIIRFNKEDDKYRIRIVDYSQYDLDGDDYNNPTGLSRLNTDIATGNAPDIILMVEQMPAENFISKGVFRDLTDYYDRDEGIDKSDFLQNILDAFKTEGKMYTLVPCFGVTGVSGKTKYIGDGKDLSIKKIRQVAASLGLKDSQIFGLETRDTILQSAIEFSGDQFIDLEKGTCTFNTKEFQELLEFVNQFPESLSEDQLMDYSSPYLGDRAILAVQYLNTLYDYEYMTRYMFADMGVTMTGFPSDKNMGPTIVAPIRFGINSNAADPEGCWSFLRRFMLPDYQMKIESYMPVSEKAIDAQGQLLIEAAKKTQEEFEEYARENGAEIVEGISAIGQETAQTDPADAADAGETGATGAQAAEDVYESGDLTGLPTPREDFDGTDEEYEEYLKEEEKRAAADDDSEEVVIGGEEAMQDNSGGYYGNNLPMFSEEDVKEVKNILKGLTFSLNGESEVLKIVVEEAAAYFAGQKTVAEVSDIIQSRVQVYLQENQ